MSQQQKNDALPRPVHNPDGDFSSGRLASSSSMSGRGLVVGEALAPPPHQQPQEVATSTITTTREYLSQFEQDLQAKQALRKTLTPLSIVVPEGIEQAEKVLSTELLQANNTTPAPTAATPTARELELSQMEQDLQVKQVLREQQHKAPASHNNGCSASSSSATPFSALSRLEKDLQAKGLWHQESAACRLPGGSSLPSSSTTSPPSVASRLSQVEKELHLKTVLRDSAAPAPAPALRPQDGTSLSSSTSAVASKLIQAEKDLAAKTVVRNAPSTVASTLSQTEKDLQAKQVLRENPTASFNHPGGSSLSPSSTATASRVSQAEKDLAEKAVIRNANIKSAAVSSTTTPFQYSAAASSLSQTHQDLHAKHKVVRPAGGRSSSTSSSTPLAMLRLRQTQQEIQAKNVLRLSLGGGGNSIATSSTDTSNPAASISATTATTSTGTTDCANSLDRIEHLLQDKLLLTPNDNSNEEAVVEQQQHRALDDDNMSHLPLQQETVETSSMSQPGAYRMPGGSLGSPPPTHQQHQQLQHADDEMEMGGQTATGTNHANTREEGMVEEGMVEARPVSDAGSVTMPQAIPTDGKAWEHHTNYYKYGLLLVVGVLVLFAVIIGGVCGAGHCDNGTTIESSSSRNETTLSHRDILLPVFQHELMDLFGDGFFSDKDKNSARQAALQWIVYDDTLQLDPYDSNMAQRYVLALFYYQTSQLQAWSHCQPIPGEGRDICYYPVAAPVGADVAGEDMVGMRWLSANHECLWAGISCVSLDIKDVDAVELGKRQPSLANS